MKLCLNESMRILYFTAGQNLELRELREQLVRIPEVLTEIKKTKGFSRDPVLAFLSCDSNWLPWVRVVQRGIQARLRRQGFKYSGLMRRDQLEGDKLQTLLLPMLQAKDHVEFYVVGPGYDDLHLHIKRLQNEFRLSCDVTFCDVIGVDPKLTWFWAELRKKDGRKAPRQEETDAAYH